MPAQPLWFLRLPAIRATVSRLEGPVLDRAAIEDLFGVRRRQAIALLHRFGGYQAGRTFLVERTSLLRQLEALESGAEFLAERSRRRRVAEDVEEARRQLPAKRVRIEAGPETFRRQLGDLPGVELAAGQLRIRFAGTADLLRQLLELAMAIQNDYERFRALCEGEESVGVDT
jgi:hypothetical protein